MKSPTELRISKFMTLLEAGDVWLSHKKQKGVKPKTIECCRGYLKAIWNFYGDKRLHEIDASSLAAYQAQRSETAGPSTINHELNILSQILRQAVCWGKLSDSYHPLKEAEWQKPKVFTPAEQDAIFMHAKRDINLELAEIAFSIMHNTGASNSELRKARLRDVDLESSPPTFRITRDVEYDVVPRLIPLNADAKEAFQRALERSNRKGASAPQQFLFPFRVNRCTWDPTRPASRSWLKKQTLALRERTGIQHLNPQMWRHQLCTEMLEQGVPTEDIVGVLGYVSENMIEAFKHTRLESKEAALGVLKKTRSGAGAATSAEATVTVPPQPDLQAELAQ